MPYSATNAVAFAGRQNGRYRDGECWTLVEDAVVGAGGRSSRGQTPNFGPNASYVWGTVVQAAALQAGDVLQFSRYSWTRTVVVDETNPDGSGSVGETSTEQGRGTPQHTAMVVRLVSPGIVEVVEQNIPGGSGPVQTIELVLSTQPPRIVRTQQAVAGGMRVTVTTTTDRVVNAPRCYRPISA